MFGAIPARRAGRPEDIAEMVVYLAGDASAFVTGTDLVIDGGATSFIGWGGPLPKP
jgi:NAD(P)-dependent dehydrogenase (short-subunit alcohol dehydrogenase family)